MLVKGEEALTIPVLNVDALELFWFALGRTDLLGCRDSIVDLLDELDL